MVGQYEIGPGGGYKNTQNKVGTGGMGGID